MKITESMIDSAIEKAVELGIIPSYNAHTKTIKNDMRQVLEAALFESNLNDCQECRRKLAIMEGR
jgi:hypothetical protein